MKHNFPPLRNRPIRGFTLIELLVVVAILIVLAALIFGLAGQAQRRAKATHCLQNLREWAVVFQYAAADRNGRLPTPQNWAAISHQPYDPDSDNPGRSPFVDYWDDDIEKALGIQLERRHCPCQEIGVAASGNVAPTYMMNWRLSKAPRYLEFIPYMIDNPAGKVLFVDGIPGAPLRLQNKGDVSKWIEPAAEFHGGSVNAVFADLHVEPLKPKTLEAQWQDMVTPGF